MCVEIYIKKIEPSLFPIDSTHYDKHVGVLLAQSETVIDASIWSISKVRGTHIHIKW
jgi:hypothetical protein